MFNETIDDDKAIVPSVGIMRLSFMLNDIYKNYPINEVTMQRLFNGYGDKYTNIDKIILLIYGVTSINSYSINEEEINKNRVDDSELSEDEKKHKGETLATSVVVLSTNIGEVVIGYDYAYVKKTEYSPNVELTELEKKISSDELIFYNFDYPYICIDNKNNTLVIEPTTTYDIFYEKESPKHNFDKFIINIDDLTFKHCYSKDIIKFDEKICKDKTGDNIMDKIPEIEGYEYVRMFDRLKRDKYNLILEYKNKENDKTYQFSYNNDYSITAIYFLDKLNTYIHEKQYFVNYYE